MNRTCSKCKESKPVCCGPETLEDDELEVSYCSECCPWRTEHRIKKVFGYGPAVCSCLTFRNYTVELVRSNTTVGTQTVISCGECGRLHVRIQENV